MIVCSITKDLGQSFSAGDIVKKIASQLDINGGGSRYMAILKLDKSFFVR